MDKICHNASGGANRRRSRTAAMMSRLICELVWNAGGEPRGEGFATGGLHLYSYPLPTRSKPSAILLEHPLLEQVWMQRLTSIIMSRAASRQRLNQQAGWR